MRFQFSSIFLSLLSFSALSSAATFSNPLRNPNGSDPFIVWSGGYYYFLTTGWTNVEISRATTLNGLKTATKKVVYSSTTADRCCSVWAPEIHYLGGKWYLYFTAGNGDNLDGQSIHVLTGKSSLDSILKSLFLLTQHRRRNSLGHVHLHPEDEHGLEHRRHGAPLQHLGQLHGVLVLPQRVAAIALHRAADLAHDLGNGQAPVAAHQCVGDPRRRRQRGACSALQEWQDLPGVQRELLLDQLVRFGAVDVEWQW